MSDLTWPEVRARSEIECRGLKVCCFDCRTNYDMVQMPCLRHCADEAERMERHKRFAPKVRAEIKRLVEVFDGD